MMKMSKKSSINGDHHHHHHHPDVGRRAWKLLRLALLWARKGGVFRRRLMMELRVVPNFLKSLAHHHHDRNDNQYYCERQLSFDKTPIFPTLKMNRRTSSSSMRFINIPCLNPPLVLDFHDHHEVDMIINNHDQLDDEDDDDDEGMITEDGTIINVREEKGCADYEDELVDIKADEFIAKFYQQIKLQRQISYLHYSSSTTIHSDACSINI
ncbi:hypothetical protein ACE6H2_028824 [Prunus campanulata]